MLMTSSVIRKSLFNPIGKIMLPESMVVHTINWFHQVMRHPGKKRLREMLNQCHHHPKLWYQIDGKEVIIEVDSYNQ
jgi:hypothetical protein